MKFFKCTISSSNGNFGLALLLCLKDEFLWNRQQALGRQRPGRTYRMRMVSDVSFNASLSDAGNIHIPPVDPMSLWDVGQQRTCLHATIGTSGGLDFVEADLLLVARSSGNTGVHHQLDNLFAFERDLAALRLFKAILGRRYLLSGERLQELCRRCRDQLCGTAMLVSVRHTYHL